MLFLALSSVILLGVTSFYISHYRVNLGQEQVAEMQQNARVALDRISQEIFMGGYGVPKTAGIVDASENGLTVLNRIDKSYTTLTAALSTTGTSLSVDAAAGFSVNDVIYLLHPNGTVESPCPKVTAVNLVAKTLTIQSGVSRIYPVGSAVTVPNNYTTLTTASGTTSTSLSVAAVANFQAGHSIYIVNPTNGNFLSRTVNSVNSGSNSLVVNSALSASYPVGSFVILPLTYGLEGSTSAPRLARRIGGVSQVLADDVESLRFTYFNASNQTLPNPLPNPYDTDPFTSETVLTTANREAIVRVEIRLAIRTHQVDPSSSNGDRYKRLVMRTEVAFRNR